MKKYFAGIGLLLAALMFFGCKQPAEQKLTKLPDEQVVTVAKGVLDEMTGTPLAGSYKFDSGFTLASTDKVEFYAARLPEKDKAVSTLFNPAYFVTSNSQSYVTSDVIKAKVGGAFYIGDRFNVGYRLVDKDGKILRSKVVAVNVISADKFYVEVDTAKLMYSLNKWQVEVKLKASKERRASLKAKLALGGKDKATKEIGETKAVVTGTSPSFIATFTWDVPAETIKSFENVPIHAILTFKDIELDDVNAKSDMVVQLANSQIYNPDNPVSADWLFKTEVVTKAGGKETVKLLEAADPVVIDVKPSVTINNNAKNVPSGQQIEGKITYYYAFSTIENKDNVPADAWQTEQVVATADDFTATPAEDLEYGTKYYLHLKATYVTKGTATGAETLKTEKLDSIVGPSFKTLDGLNAAGLVYDMKSAKTTIFESTTQHMLIGSLLDTSTTPNVPYLKDTPAALKTDGTKDGASLKLDNGKKIDSYPKPNYKYNTGALSFKMRLPGESDIKTSIVSAAPKLLSSEDKPVTGHPGTPVPLVTFTATGADSVKAEVAYYPPTYKSENTDTTGFVATNWKKTEDGAVKLVITANGKDTFAGTVVLPIKEIVLTSDTALNNVTAAAVVVGGAIEEVSFDANKWVDWLNCDITLTNTKITVKAAEASAEVTFEKKTHFDLIENGFDAVTLKSGLNNIHVKEVKYMVTK